MKGGAPKRIRPQSIVPQSYTDPKNGNENNQTQNENNRLLGQTPKRRGSKYQDLLGTDVKVRTEREKDRDRETESRQRQTDRQ